MTSPAVSETERALPLSYRRNLMSAVMDCIKGGECCSLIGVASVGKSNLLRFLMRPDVREYYLGQGWDRFLFVFIDCNKIAEVSEWGVFELFLHGLLERLENLEEPGPWSQLIDRFDTQYQQVVASRDRLLAQRYLSRWVGTLVRKSNLRFVFFLDEFDDVLGQLDPCLFLNILALRDEHKYGLSYVFTTRRILTLLRADMETTLESFYELFSRNVFPMTPYDRADAREMVNRLMARRQVALSNEEIIEALLAASGGHPGLLRAAFELACNTPADKVMGALKRMLEDYSVESECRKIWDSLAEQEREVLSRFATERQWSKTNDVVAKHLEIKGLLVTAKVGETFFFSPVFAQWVRRESRSQGRHPGVTEL